MHLDLGLQPLGVLPLPAGMLLLPDTEAAAETATLLRRGRIPVSYPPEAGYYALAARGATPEEVLVTLGSAGAESAYNRLVLTGDAVLLEELRFSCSGDMRLLVEIQGFLRGACDLPPMEAAQSDLLKSLLASAHAARLIEQGAHGEATSLLRRGIRVSDELSPVLAAGLHGDLARILSVTSTAMDEAIDEWRAARAALLGTDFKDALAEVTLSLAVALHGACEGNPGRLSEAIGLYLEAARLASSESSPGVFGGANMNLALAYLAIPMTEASDQLRYGVALSCLRTAAKVFAAAGLEEDLAAARMNLASALVYAPSGRQGDNLVEAVEIYEEVAAWRSAQGDMLGYARARANQGTALAHLGIFEQGIGRLHEARAIFEEFGSFAETAGVREMLDHIARERAGR